MDMSDSSTSDGMMLMMTPWLHFNGGDSFFFKSLHPSSKGAIAGACIVLVAISIFERWVSAMRGVLEIHWANRLKAIAASSVPAQESVCAASSVKEKDISDTDVASLPDAPLKRASLRSGRASPPFIASHDLTRGAIFAFQALLTYLLMLAVMTFQAAYIISIVVGLGLGEILFGRMGGAGAHMLH